MSTVPNTTNADPLVSISSVVAEKVYTPEELLALPDSKSFELVDGKLTERNRGAESGRIGHIIASRLEVHANDHNLGMVWGADCSYQIFGEEAGKVRRPDGSFIAKGRLPDDLPPKGHIKIAPDLAIEVVSPHDLAVYIDAKIDEYLGAGVRLIWVVYPESKHVLVYRSGSDVQRLGVDDELSGEDILPGFKLAISKVFPAEPTRASD